MKAQEFIQKNIGNPVYITGDRDLTMSSELRPLIFFKRLLFIVKLTKGGKAYLTDGEKFYSVPPSNVREYKEIPNDSITDNETIRQIALYSNRTHDTSLIPKVKTGFEYAGLYPEVIKSIKL